MMSGKLTFQVSPDDVTLTMQKCDRKITLTNKDGKITLQGRKFTFEAKDDTITLTTPRRLFCKKGLEKYTERFPTTTQDDTIVITTTKDNGKITLEVVSKD